MKVLELGNNFKTLSIIEKRDYLKKILENNSLKIVINSLIISNDDIIENFEIINSLARTKIFKEKNSITSLELISMIIGLYVKNNKTRELEKYFKVLDEKKLKNVINYEIEHKTEFSKLKPCTKMHDKLNENTEIKKKKIVADETISKPKNKKKKVSIFFIVFMLFIVICYVLVGYCYHKINFYNSHVYPNIYLDNVLISDMDNNEIIKLLEQKDNLLNETITFKNENDSFTYSYDSIGYSSNTNELKKEIIEVYKNINGFQKLYEIFLGNKKE